jgi:hypothetical protein
LALYHNPSDFHFPSSCDYRHEPQNLVPGVAFQTKQIGLAEQDGRLEASSMPLHEYGKRKVTKEHYAPKKEREEQRQGS